MSDSLTPAQAALKAHFDASLDPSDYDASWARLLVHAPAMFAAATRLTAVPRARSALLPKTQALVSLAVAAAATHLHVPAVHRHTARALRLGASRAEIVETLCLTATLGVHACNVGVPLLVEVLREEGVQVGRGMEDMSEAQWALRREFERKRGYWHAFWEDFLRMSPEFFGAYVEFSGVPWTEAEGETQEGEGEGGSAGGNAGGKVGVLEPKVKELIYCAFDAAATHLYKPGLKLHMKNVLGYGGTAEEIVEVLELATLLSVSTLDVGLGVLEVEMEAHGKGG